MRTRELSPTPRSTIERNKVRAASDRAALDATLDAGLICHLGMSIDGTPRVLPTGYGRIGDTLYLHGSSGARSLREADDAEICVAVTVVDGVVYARASFHCSMNYRSAVIHGRSRKVTGDDERRQALRAITEHLAPGTWDHARKPNKRELAATTVIALELDEAAVKIRSGGPNDDEPDIAEGAAWAGALPLHQYWGSPQPCEQLAANFPTPAHIEHRRPLGD